jgi:hypothetical protein
MGCRIILFTAALDEDKVAVVCDGGGFDNGADVFVCNGGDNVGCVDELNNDEVEDREGGLFFDGGNKATEEVDVVFVCDEKGFDDDGIFDVVLVCDEKMFEDGGFDVVFVCDEKGFDD